MDTLAFVNGLSDDQMRSALGVSRDVFNQVYERYCNRKGRRDISRPHLYRLLYWLKNYPPWHVMTVIFNVERVALMRGIYRHLRYLGPAMKPLVAENWAARREVGNPCQDYFDGHCIGSVDTFPVYVGVPQSTATRDHKALRKSLWQPKYKGAVLKFQVIVGHTGLPIFVNGPFCGVMHDFKIWRKYGATAFMAPDEVVLGDRAYTSKAHPRAEMVAQHKKTRGRELTQHEKDFNEVHGWFRAGVEHFFGHAKRWTILGGKYRQSMGHPEAAVNLGHALDIIVGLLTLRIRQHPLRVHRPIELPVAASDDAVIDADGAPAAPDHDAHAELDDVAAVLDGFAIDDNVGVMLNARVRALDAVDAKRAGSAAEVDSTSSRPESKIPARVEVAVGPIREAGPWEGSHLSLLRSVIIGDWSHDVVVSADGKARGHGVEPSDLPVNTGYAATMFRVGEDVLTWWWGKWWPARVVSIASRANTLRLKWDHWLHATSGNKARCSMPRRVYEAFRQRPV